MTSFLLINTYTDMSRCTQGNASCIFDGEGQRITHISNCSPFAPAPVQATVLDSSASPSRASSPIDIPRCREPDYSPGGSYQSPVAACAKRRAEPDDLTIMLKAARLASSSHASDGLPWRDTYTPLGESPSVTTAHTVPTKPPRM